MRVLFRRQCCGGGSVIGNDECGSDSFRCGGFFEYSGCFSCPSAFGVVDVEEVLPQDGFFDESEAEGGFDEAVERFGRVEVGGVLFERLQELFCSGEGFFVAEVESRRLHSVGGELCVDEGELCFGVLCVGRGWKFVDEGFEGFFGLYHIDLSSFDVLDVLEIDEPFEIQRVGEGRGGGVCLDEGVGFEDGFDFLFFPVVSEREEDLRSGGEFGVGVVVGDDF